MGGEGGIYRGKMEKEIWNETGSLSICSFAAKFRKIKRLFIGGINVLCECKKYYTRRNEDFSFFRRR